MIKIFGTIFFSKRKGLNRWRGPSSIWGLGNCLSLLWANLAIIYTFCKNMSWIVVMNTRPSLPWAKDVYKFIYLPVDLKEGFLRCLFQGCMVDLMQKEWWQVRALNLNLTGRLFSDTYIKFDGIFGYTALKVLNYIMVKI